MATIKFLAGLMTQRSPFAAIDTRYGTRFLGGKPDALIAGSNVEISNKLTLQRRPGLLAYGTTSIPAPLTFFSWEEVNPFGITLIVDTAPSVYTYSPTQAGIWFNKGTTSQSNFLGLINTLYVGDGVDLLRIVGPNLLVQSNSFNTANWTSANAQLTPGQADPTGGFNATQVVWNATGLTSFLYQQVTPNLTPVASNTFTYALWIKQTGGAESVTIYIQNQAGSTIASSTVALTGSFVKYSVTGTMGGGDTAIRATLSNPTATTAIVIYGGQLEPGGPATPTQITTVKAQGVYNWGIAPPTVAPTLTIDSSGVNAPTWTAATNSGTATWFSTMGLIVDSNGNVQQLVAVTGGIAVGSFGQLGTSSTGQPAWVQTVNSLTTPDGGVTWRNMGQVTTWGPFKGFRSETQCNQGIGGNASCCIWDPQTGTFQVMVASGSGITGNTRPNFSVIPGAIVTGDQQPGAFASAGCSWMCLGTPAQANSHTNGYFEGAWRPNHAYSAPPGPSRVIEPWIPPAQGQPLPSTPMFFQEPTVSGTSSASFTNPKWGTTAGSTILDNQLTWAYLSSATWASSTTYIAWTSPIVNNFAVSKDSNGSLWVCIVGGTSGASDPFAVWYRADTTYVAGQTIIDTNSNLQLCTTGGTTTGGAPVWATTKGSSTNDTGGVVWLNQGSAYGTKTTESTGVQWVNVGQSSSWTASQQYYLPNVGFVPPPQKLAFGGVYVKDSNNNIEYVVQTGTSGTTQPTWQTVLTKQTVDSGVVWYLGTLGTSVPKTSLSPVTGYQYYFAFLDSVSGQPSNVSPISISSGPLTASVITVSGPGSGDPQVDQIAIYRNTDGGVFWFQLATVPNPGANGTWYFADSTPDLGLNSQIFAPIGLLNTVPPAGALDPVQHAQRTWVHAGTTLFYSAGPDNARLINITFNGVSAASWPPLNNIPFDAPITRKISTQAGLLVWTTRDLWIVTGTDLNSFFAVKILFGHGLRSWNALSFDGSTFFAQLSDREFVTITPSLGSLEVGFPIGDLIESTIDPTKCYVTRHVGGSQDNALYLADGSTGWFRLNPNQVGASLSGEQTELWSPFATIVGGCGAIASVETSAGIFQLLVGGTSTGPVLVRSITTFTDNGSAYTWSATIGSIILATSGTLAETESISTEMTGVSTQCALAVLLDEISGSFETLSNSVNDPPQLATSLSVLSVRFYLSQGTTPPVCRHLQIKLSGAAINTKDELLSLSIRGALVPEQV